MSAADRSELAGYEELVSELRASAPVAPERLRERVLESAPAARGRRSRKRKLVLVVVPAAVVLAVAAALVHGFLSTGSHASLRASIPAVQHGLRAQKPQPKSAHRAPGSATTSKKLTTGAHSSDAFSDEAQSSQGSLNRAALGPSATTPTSDSILSGRSVTIPKHRLVHAVASLEVGVSRANLSQATNNASQIVGSLGGYAQSVRYQASRAGYGEALLELRVPVQRAQTAIAKLGNLGKLLSQEVSTQDLQQRLTHQNSAIGSLHRAIAVYENALASSTLPASQRVIIQIRLNNARRSLSKLQHARKGTLASGATADISLVLTTRSHAVVVHHKHGSGRFGRLLGSAAGFLGLEGIIVIYALVVLSPVLLLGALAWWIVRERRRREERLLASA